MIKNLIRIITMCAVTLTTAAAVANSVMVHSEHDSASSPSTKVELPHSGMNDINTVGTAGLLAILIIREVFEFLRKREEQKTSSDIFAIKKQVADLWDWHNHQDDDGVMVWYRRKSAEEAVDRLTSAIEKQTQLSLKTQLSIERLVDKIDFFVSTNKQQ